MRHPVPDGVLAEGEATGHAHRVPVQVERDWQTQCRYFTTEDDTIVTHEEHGPIALPARRKMASGIVREMDHVQMRLHPVAD
jgi:hypothetical protein